MSTTRHLRALPPIPQRRLPSLTLVTQLAGGIRLGFTVTHIEGSHLKAAAYLGLFGALLGFCALATIGLAVWLTGEAFFFAVRQIAATLIAAEEFLR